MKLCKVREHYHYTSEYTVAAHSLFNLKYSIPIKITMVFYNRSSYDCLSIIKELEEEFEKIASLGENSKKYKSSSVALQKEVQELIKMEKKWQKPHPTDYNLLIGEYFWQVLYQILLMMWMKEVITLNINLWNSIQRLRLIFWINTFSKWFNWIQMFMLKQKLSTKYWWKVSNSSIHANFLNMIAITLFYCCEKVFTLMNIGWLGETQWNIITWKRRFL